MDVQDDYKERAMTKESFRFIDGAAMAMLHPCKQAKSLLFLCDKMQEDSGEPVKSEDALFLFLKLVGPVLPTIKLPAGELCLRD